MSSINGNDTKSPTKNTKGKPRKMKTKNDSDQANLYKVSEKKSNMKKIHVSSDTRGNFGGNSVQSLTVSELVKSLDKSISAKNYPSIYERLNFGTAIKPYFDVDFHCDTKDQDKDQELLIFEQHLSALEMEFGISREDIECFNSSGYDHKKDKWKVSFHFIVNNGKSYSDGLELKELAERLTEENHLLPGFDTSIYKASGRCQKLRIPYCVKYGSDRVLKSCKDTPHEMLSWANFSKVSDKRRLLLFSSWLIQIPETEQAIKMAFNEAQKSRSKTKTKTKTKTQTSKTKANKTKANKTSKTSEENARFEEFKEALFGLKKERSDDRSLWRDTLFSVADYSKTFSDAFEDDFEGLAIDWSKQSDKFDEEEVLKIYNGALTRGEKNDDVKKDSVFHWLNIDNPTLSKALTAHNASKLKAKTRKNLIEAMNINEELTEEEEEEEEPEEEQRELIAKHQHIIETFQKACEALKHIEPDKARRLNNYAKGIKIVQQWIFDAKADKKRKKTKDSQKKKAIVGKLIDDCKEIMGAYEDLKKKQEREETEEETEEKAERFEAEADKYKEVNFEVLRDYKILLKLDRESNGKGIPASLVSRYIRDTIIIIENGGKSTILTKNKKLDENGAVQIWFQTVGTSEVIKTLAKKCMIQNPDFNPKMKEGKNNQRFYGKGNYISEWFTKMAEEDAIPNYNSREFLPYLKDKPKLYDTFNLFGGFPLQREIEKMEEQREDDEEGGQNDVLLCGGLFEKSKIYEHLRDKIHNRSEEDFQYTLNWIAHMIQKPAERPGTNIVIHSPQGGGKDLLGQFITILVGQYHALKYGNVRDWLQKHNIEQQGKLFMVLNEISDRGEAFKNHNEIKGKTDEKRQRFEPKGLEVFYLNNYARYIFFSNNLNALFIENSDRRYHMVKHSGEKCNDWDYFAPMWEEIKDKNFLLSAFAYFSKRDISGWKPSQLPSNDYRETQKMAGISSPYRFLTEALKGDFEFNPNYKKNLAFVKDEGLIGSVPALYDLFKEWSIESGEKKPMKRLSFKEKLEELGLVCKTYVLKKDGSHRTTIKGFRIQFDQFEKLMRKHTNNPNFKLFDEEDEEDEDEKRVILESEDSDSDSDDDPEILAPEEIPEEIL
jgi:hypothetical protein